MCVWWKLRPAWGKDLVRVGLGRPSLGKGRWLGLRYGPDSWGQVTIDRGILAIVLRAGDLGSGSGPGAGGCVTASSFVGGERARTYFIILRV